MVARNEQRYTKPSMCLCVAIVECDRSTHQCLDRVLRLDQIAGWKSMGCVVISHAEAPVTARKGRIEVDRLLKEPLCVRVVGRRELTEMPQAALVSGPGVEASGRLAQRPLPLCHSNGRGDRDRHRLG